MSLLDAAGVINGDIWCNGAFDFESPLKDLLDSGEYTMEQLLAEDELLQELRGVHPQLIQFFSSEEAVATLIQYIILPPSTEPPTKTNGAAESDSKEQAGEKNGESKNESMEADNKTIGSEDKSIEPGKWLEGDDPTEEATTKKLKSPQEEMEDLHIRFPYMACEVICCEIKTIIDILVDGVVPTLPDNGEDDAEKTKPKSSLVISDEDRGKPILDLLFSMLYKSEIGEIDDYRAGYFEKVLSILFRYRPKDIARYLDDGGGKGNVTLMSAMFKHLYSHSLMQIVQRLLLPQPPLPERPEGEGTDDPNECQDLFNDTLEADMDPLDNFRCNWCESEKALEMVMECLIGEDTIKPVAKIQMDGDDEDERMLDLYQNASEVLITIIQNSPLTSLTMQTLTTDPNLGRLIKVSTQVEDGVEFSRHDSKLTCAMNVLESIILQLGGYGSVGTMLYDGEGQPFEGMMGEPMPDEQNKTSQEPGGTSQATNQPKMLFATPETLIYHLPGMLLSLSHLLAYPGAEDWKSPMQFSKTEPQPILGSSRLRIVRLLESLVLLGNNRIDTVLCDSSCLELCLDLFWKFQWCSMLHQSVANLLVHAFEGQNSRSELQTYFIERCNLIGRLMYSFWKKEPETNIATIISDSNVELSESVTGEKGSESEKSSVASEKESGSTSDVLPVSDDDVDAAMERQEDGGSIPGLQGGQSTDSSETKSDSLRLGYMGHVIIICQALVHACTEEGDAPTVDSNGMPIADEEGQLGSHLGSDSTGKPKKQSDDCSADDYTSAYTSTDGDTLADSLILARLVKKHPLGKIWKDFVVTTLASETALQTTPLGGFQNSTLGVDPLHMHRPGLEDDGAYDDDDGEAPTLPQRGLLVDGDVIDMDDNDLEIAANMMAGLNLAQGNGGSQTQSNIAQGGYVFDDPLGGGRFDGFDDSDDDVDDDDDGGDSSSDEEPEMIENSREAPVMDLFAGNFDAFNETDTGQPSPSAFSDFANFDDAFADTDAGNDNPKSPDKNEFDSMFAEVKNHDILLDELDKPMSPQNGALSDDTPPSTDAQSPPDQEESS